MAGSYLKRISSYDVLSDRVRNVIQMVTLERQSEKLAITEGSSNPGPFLTFTQLANRCTMWQ